MKLWIVACGEQQNPLLDHDVLEKFGVKADDALLADEMEIVDMEGLEYITGGGTQNSIRVAQWMFEKKAASFIGCVGKDDCTHKMQATCEKGNVARVYMVDENTFSTTYACCIVGTERSLIAVSPVSITLASSHYNKKDETYCTNLSAPFFVEVHPFKEVLMKTMPSTDVFFGNETEAWILVSSCFVVVPLLAPAPEPKTRSNTTNDRDLIIVLFHHIILSFSSLTGPRIQTTSPNKWQIRSVQHSFGNIGNFEDDDEERDNTPEEIHEAIHVKTINGKTISTRYYKNMTAAVILEEVERRTQVPRDMTRLVHKGKMINGKKSMKENNIEAKEMIEMSLRLLGGMEVNEQMDTHETEEDREKKRKLDEGKEGKMTKPNEDMAHLKRDIMEALRKSDEKWIATQERPTKKWNATPERLMKK